MNDPRPLRSHAEGAAARAGRVVELVRLAGALAREERAALYWQLCRRIARFEAEGGGARACRARRLGPALGMAAGAFLVIALIVAYLAGQPPGRNAALPRVAETLLPAAQPGETAPPSLDGSESWHHLAFGDLGELELSPSGELELRELPNERQIRVGRGTLRAQVAKQDPLRPVTIVSPHLRVVVLGTRFDVHVHAESTLVEVLEGRVCVEPSLGALAVDSETAVLLDAGMAISSDDPRLGRPAAVAAAPAVAFAPRAAALPSLPAARVPAVAPMAERGRRRLRTDLDSSGTSLEACAHVASPQQRRACYERLAAAPGQSLVAEAALFALGQLARDLEGQPDRALRHFQAYASRFPDGALAPEAALGALQVLKSQGRTEEAVEAAERFERRFSTDPRVREVALIRAELLCRQPARRTEALQLMSHLEAKADAALAAAIAGARARCGVAPAELGPNGRP